MLELKLIQISKGILGASCKYSPRRKTWINKSPLRRKAIRHTRKTCLTLLILTFQILPNLFIEFGEKIPLNLPSWHWGVLDVTATGVLIEVITGVYGHVHPLHHTTGWNGWNSLVNTFSAGVHKELVDWFSKYCKNTCCLFVWNIDLIWSQFV